MIDRRRLLALGLCPLPGAGVRAASQPALTGPVVLTVSGQVEAPGGGNRMQFDMAALSRFAQTSFTARTPWYTQPRKFTGPLLRDVLDAAGSRGPLLRAVALNDYRVDIPADDARRYDMVLARLIDDQPIAVRDKGPLFIIYPFDSASGLRTAVYFSRCAWQLRAIEVVGG